MKVKELREILEAMNDDGDVEILLTGEFAWRDFVFSAYSDKEFALMVPTKVVMC